MVPLEKYDWLPAAHLKARIDAFGFGDHFLDKLPVAGDVRAARCSNLYKREPLLVGGVQLQEALDGMKTLQDSLGIVNAVHTHAEKRRLNSEFGARRRAFFRGTHVPIRCVPILGSRD